MYPRAISEVLRHSAEKFPVVTLSGPRQAGKTTLVKSCFPDHTYINLEAPDTRQFAEQDPRGFFRQFCGPSVTDFTILDEVQRVPSLVSYIQTFVDENKIKGQFILTGSHQLELNQAVSQSLAGRTALLTLLPLSLSELNQPRVSEECIYEGFLPQVHAEGLSAHEVYRYYFRTYVERDVRLMINIKDISRFEQFIQLCAGRIGQLFNASQLANEVGVSSNTIQQWLSILEASHIVYRLKPYYENLGKRLVKSPKLYFTDVGLACYLLGLKNAEQVSRDPLRGQLFENLVVIELLKHRYNTGSDADLYFYRDANGHEVDVLFKSGRSLRPIEIKASETYHPQLAKNVRYLETVLGDRFDSGYVIYAGDLRAEQEGCKFLNFNQAEEALSSQ